MACECAIPLFAFDRMHTQVPGLYRDGVEVEE
jgi:hypothetical protein